jgi:hypothetical protein
MDKEKLKMFIGRRPDNSIYGSWASTQPNDKDHPGIEEVADDHPDLLAFLVPKPEVPDPIDELRKKMRANPELLGKIEALP